MAKDDTLEDYTVLDDSELDVVYKKGDKVDKGTGEDKRKVQNKDNDS